MRRRKKPIPINKDAKADMTAMLGIIFILLIFFIVTTSFVKEKGFWLINHQLKNHLIILPSPLLFILMKVI